VSRCNSRTNGFDSFSIAAGVAAQITLGQNNQFLNIVALDRKRGDRSRSNVLGGMVDGVLDVLRIVVTSGDHNQVFQPACDINLIVDDNPEVTRGPPPPPLPRPPPPPAPLLAQRARAAENLLGGCRADGGKFCYSAGYRRDIGHGASSRGADFAFGYGISDNFDAAVSLAVPARAEENGSHRLKSGVGIGLSARLHNGAGWYAVPAAAFETDKTRIRRPHLDGTESPENTVRTKGRAYSLTAGRDYGTSGEKTLGWYAALRRTEAERPSYSEDASLSFPFAYGAAKLKETSLAAGIKGRLPLTGKLAWYGNAEVAQRVGGGKARFTAEAPFFGKYETERETTRTRPSVQTGVDYAFSPSAVLSLGGYVGRNAFSGTDKGIFLKLNGKF